MRALFSTILIFLALGMFAQTPKGVALTRVNDFQDLESKFTTDSDSTYVINFWATWCGPCVKELPYFERVNEEMADDKVKVILVSLDFKRQIDKKLIPFMINKRIKSEVIALTDTRSNQWIDQVDPEWSGSIPATLIFNKNKKLFLEQEFESYEELEELIKSF